MATEEKDSASILNYFRKMLRLRKDSEILIYGAFTLVDTDNPDVFAFTREWKGKKWLVLLNFRNHTVKTNTGLSYEKARPLISNYDQASADGSLRAYEAVIFEF